MADEDFCNACWAAYEASAHEHDRVAQIRAAEREVERDVEFKRRTALSEASEREARRHRGGSGPSKQQRTTAEAEAHFEARRAKDAVRNAGRDAKMRAASDARVRSGQTITAAETIRAIALLEQQREQRRALQADS